MDDPKLSAMFSKGLGELRSRAAAHRQAPELTLGLLADLISLAISYGVTLYNEGRHDYCYQLYAEVALQITASEVPEWGPLDTQEAYHDLERALRDSQYMEESDAAWCMRHAFDKAMLAYQIQDRHIHLLVEMGQSAFARGDYGGAASAYQRATVNFDQLKGPDPEETPAAWRLAYLLLGHTWFAAGRYEQAAEVIRAGMCLVPDWCGSRIRIQDQYLDKDRLQAQIEALGAHLGEHPEDRQARFLYGYVHFFSDEKPAASRILRHHLQLFPEDEQAQEIVGAAMLAMV
jgi:tetratricopeptide (TPR) repeat protein